MKRIAITILFVLMTLISCQSKTQSRTGNIDNDLELQSTPSILTRLPNTPSRAPSSQSLPTSAATTAATPSRALAATVLPTSVVTLPSATPSRLERFGGMLAYVGEGPDTFYQIYITDSEGNEHTQLTHGAQNFFDPRWSPDGQKILFQSAPQGSILGHEIWVMNSDGTEQMNLTHNTTSDYSPSWSPDGRRIVFVSERDGNAEIYLMGADGSNLIRITDNPGRDYSPDWSPRGDEIVFVSDREGNANIYVVNTASSEFSQLTEQIREEQQPTWSPDGTKIAFIADESLWIMDANGDNQRRVVDELTANSPFWSPNSQLIVFEGYEDDLDYYRDVYLVDIDGGTPIRITDNSKESSSGPWSPIGNSVTIGAGSHLAVYDLYIVEVDQFTTTRLTDNLSLDCCAVWQP